MHSIKAFLLLKVRASDGGFEKQLSSTATVMVDVQDVQDQPPVFLNAPFSATVREASSPVSFFFSHALAVVLKLINLLHLLLLFFYLFILVI